MFYQFNHLASPNYFKIERDKNFNFPPHLHQCFEVIIILSGKMQLTVNTKNYTLTKNQALLIFPNQIHSLHSTDSEHILCIFSPHLVQAFTTKAIGKIPKNNFFLPDKYLINVLKHINSTSNTTEKKGVLYSLCSQFDKSALYETRQTDNENLLFKIFSFVESEYKNDCSLNKLANNIGYDYSYLSRYFKKIVGISFNTYVNHYRLSYACYLMENSNLSIMECALESGYISLRSFNRNFKEYFKITPIQYRKNKKNNI